MADNTPASPGNPNHSLNRRREERAMEQLVQDSSDKFGELAATQMEIWQRQLGLGSQITGLWSDGFNVAQQSFGRMIETIQQQQQRRA